MKIMLLKNISGLGEAGDIKEVSDGYARNYLLKKNLAKSATETVIREAEIIKSEKKQKESERVNKLVELSKVLSQSTIVIKAKQKNGRLFGSINKKIIAEELRKNNFSVNENSVIIKEPIKAIGEQKISLDLGHGIKTTFLLKILPE